ncbi:similar to MFS multidrug transporter [Plenodomus lingam JN3]|uniref:Similar to MFS multidrug transporter n=1 Tax=Leptosphaeria maculans (strain JN3 / isolate v23.1.3 / race Av1-4-5-6-7-8) TaxID=985895 RepID=E5ADZ4_LEPMJ|nr:similar to MFS multidrug transporter [Plenodomus lingam JN3]CBY01433.1 similar to MFS multidrug transporter [Plenodomus lingam JN3]
MSHLSKQPVDASMGASENHQRLCEKSSTESSHGHSQLQPSLLPQDTHSVKPQTLDTTTTKQPPIATNWTGTNDMDNPHNWSTWKRSYHIIIPALFGFAVTFGTSVYTPALPDIMRDFNVSRTLALLGLTVYTIGLALGPILTAPLSERYGRKIIYMVHSPIFMLFTLGAGFSKNFASLCVCRLLAGASGSPGLAVGAGTNADLFPPHQRAVTTSLFLMAPFAGPALGPVVGGFIAQYKSWQWTQWSMIFITLAITLAGLPMQETFKPVILARRAKKAGISLPVKPPQSQAGLTFIVIGIGVLLGGLTSILIDRTVYQRKYKHAITAGKQIVEPEHRLYSAMIGGTGVVVGLFWFGWCADRDVHWAITLLGAVPFAWGNVCLFASSALYLTDVYGFQYGASAMAANGIARYTLGGIFPLFTVQMYEALGIGWATSLLGFLALAMIPIPFIFFKYGRAIRAKSKYPVVI